jgi:hypothetical protein
MIVSVKILVSLSFGTLPKSNIGREAAQNRDGIGLDRKKRTGATNPSVHGSHRLHMHQKEFLKGCRGEGTTGGRASRGREPLATLQEKSELHVLS